ncbi:bactofilin family protein [Sphingomonas sp.]|uniref:bactofilin family protein n=1 Tax=Sphingomonas sp. TaxID=28214 RepID=UPI003CC591AC
MPATGARNTPFSLIGGDVVITGNIAATVDLHIDGRIDGDTSCAALVQGPDSVIRGGVTAKTARIAGRFEGSITADELIILATARVTGDCSYGRLQIEAGAQIDGRLTSRESDAKLELKVVAG